MYQRDTRYRGRKMQPGKIVADPATGRMGVFICYCPNPQCRIKVIVDRPYITGIARRYHSERRSIKHRAYNYILSHYSDPSLEGTRGGEDNLLGRHTTDSI